MTCRLCKAVALVSIASSNLTVDAIAQFLASSGVRGEIITFRAISAVSFTLK
jgi:hypothetical protein